MREGTTTDDEVGGLAWDATTTFSFSLSLSLSPDFLPPPPPVAGASSTTTISLLFPSLMVPSESSPRPFASTAPPSQAPTRSPLIFLRRSISARADLVGAREVVVDRGEGLAVTAAAADWEVVGVRGGSGAGGTGGFEEEGRGRIAGGFGSLGGASRVAGVLTLAGEAGVGVVEEAARAGIVVDLGTETDASTFPAPLLTSAELLLDPAPIIPPPFLSPSFLLSFLLSFSSAAFSNASNNDGFTGTTVSLFPPPAFPKTEGFVLIEGTGGGGSVLLMASSLPRLLLPSSSSSSSSSLVELFQLGGPTIFPSTTNNAACSSASSTILSNSATDFIVPPAVLSPASPMASKYPLP